MWDQTLSENMSWTTSKFQLKELKHLYFFFMFSQRNLNIGILCYFQFKESPPQTISFLTPASDYPLRDTNGRWQEGTERAGDKLTSFEAQLRHLEIQENAELEELTCLLK